MIDRRLRWASLVISVLGIGVAGYLVYVHYAGIAPICSISHGCEIVQSSKYSKIVGVPVAVIGLIGYVAILVSLFFRGELARLATAGMALIGLGFSAWLTYAEGKLIHAWCQWCLSSAGLMTLLAIVSVWRLLILPPPRDGGFATEEPKAKGGIYTGDGRSAAEDEAMLDEYGFGED